MNFFGVYNAVSFRGLPRFGGTLDTVKLSNRFMLNDPNGYTDAPKTARNTATNAS